MRFQSGVLGVVIVVAAVMATVLAGIVLNTHDTLVTKTEYERVTDISGLWDYTDEPEYLDYDPISNWTGFHTEGGEKPSGIDYTTLQSGSNRYAINNETWTGTLSMDARTVWDNPFPSSTTGWQAVVATEPYDDSTDFATDQYGDYSTITGWWGPGGNHLTSCVQPLSRILSGMGYGTTEHVVIDVAGGDVWFSQWSQWSYGSHYLAVVVDPPIRENFYWIDYATATAAKTLDISTGSGAVVAYDANGNLLWSGTTSTVVGFISAGFIDHGTPEYYYEDSNPDRPDFYTVVYKYTTGISTSYMDISKGVSLVPNTNVYWDNGHMNRVVTMTVHLEPGKAAQMSIVNYYNGATNQPIYINMDTTTSVQDIRVNVPTQGTISITGYNHAQIRMDTETNTLTVTPIVGWQGFTQYETLDALGKSVGLSALSQPGPITQMHIWANRTSFAQDMMSFGIVRTTVFMNTYDAVLKDATFDATRYFDYDLFRLNLVSFALYGDSLTVAGNTYPVTDGEITIDGKQYKLNDVALEYDMRDPDAETVSFVTDTDKVIPLGTATPLTVNGIWYFTTWLDRGSEYTATETSFDLTGWAFEGNGPAILFFIGVLVLGTIVSTRLQAPTFLDLAVVGIAGFIGYILMG